MSSNQERGYRGRFIRGEDASEQTRIRAMAQLIGESALFPTGEELSNTEMRALLAVAQGKPPKEIAWAAMAFSVPHLRKTVYSSVRKKLGARNMAHAVRLGFEDRLIDPSLIEAAPRKALSPTQRDVLELITLGATNKDICRILEIAPATSTHHLIDIKTRYGVETTEHATSVGIVIGDVPLDLAA